LLPAGMGARPTAPGPSLLAELARAHSQAQANRASGNPL